MLWIEDRKREDGTERILLGTSLINATETENGVHITKLNFKKDEVNFKIADIGIRIQDTAKKTANDKKLFDTLIGELAAMEDDVLFTGLAAILKSEKEQRLIVSIDDDDTIYTNTNQLDILIATEIAQRLGTKTFMGEIK
jgi:hypothetical protein